jgi:cysteine-rich repeat protein
VRRLAAGAGLVLAAGALAAAWSCGSDSPPVCGDGVVEGSEQCDDGNADETDQCRACVSYTPARTIIKWSFNADAAPGFTTDGCTDVGATRVRVDLSGPTTTSKDAPCPDRQVAFDGLPAGMYTAAVTPLDEASQALVSAPATATFTATDASNTTEEHAVVVPPEAWSRPMTGTFYFVLRWGGMACAAPVATQTVTMRIMGVPVNRSTTTTPVYKLDGSQSVACVMSSTGMAEAATMLPFGHAQIEVVGRNSGGVEQYRGTFETFVGAGVANPVITVDVPSTVDAGVDAAIDAPPGA